MHSLSTYYILYTLVSREVKMQLQNMPQRIFQIHAPDPPHIWVRDFLLDVHAANRTNATIEFYTEKLERFLTFLQTQGVSDPAGITPTVLRRFLVELGQERSPGGVHAHRRAVRAFVRFLVREDALERNPLDKVRSPRVDQELLEPVRNGTVHALLATCDKSELGRRDRAILLTLLDTGLRASELVGLNVGDVDLNDGSVTVHRAKSRKGRIVFAEPAGAVGSR
jgi:site-specific recombinase XerD